MNREPSLSLSPKARFLADPAVASAHSDLMASPAFLSAASAALLHYQYKAVGGDPAVLAVSAAKLRGAQEFLRELLNLGFAEHTDETIPDHNLTPPEAQLDAPFAPPQ